MQRCFAADRKVELHRAELPEFVEDVENRFPDDQLAGLQLSSEQATWLEWLEETLPGTIRKQHAFLVAPLQHLRILLESLEAATTAAARVVSQMPVPVRTNLSPYKLPALFDLAKLVASTFPLRPEWLHSEHWPRLRSAGQAALTNFEDGSRIAKRLEGRLTANQLVELSQVLDAPEQLQSAWSTVKSILPDGNVEDLPTLQRKLNAGLLTLGELNVCIQQILGSVGAETALSPPFALARSLEAAIITSRFFRLVFDQFANEDRLLGEFDVESHEQSRERFRKLDEWEVRAASSRIRQYQLGRDDRPRAGWFAEATSELGILQKEIQKKRRQLPLRKLFAEIPNILQRLKPCIMMSPLSVSTFLQSDELRFDIVIFDEASQVSRGMPLGQFTGARRSSWRVTRSNSLRRTSSIALTSNRMRKRWMTSVILRASRASANPSGCPDVVFAGITAAGASR